MMALWYVYALLQCPDSDTRMFQIKSSTTRQDIVPGTVCDWTPVNGKAVRDMPAATAAPDDFPVGAFGTVNLPSKWRNTIWCATGSGGDYSCIYVDTDANATSGLNYRSYVVKNTFQVCVMGPYTLDALTYAEPKS